MRSKNHPHQGSGDWAGWVIMACSRPGLILPYWLLVSAATREVRDERERIARDAASAVQAALRGGVLPGGGAIEIAAAIAARATRDAARGWQHTEWTA